MSPFEDILLPERKGPGEEEKTSCLMFNSMKNRGGGRKKAARKQK